MGRSNFRRDIQGLRALAVVAVVLNHALPNLITGGFVGVDIFFVISGYLIPQIIVRDIEAGEFSVADFYRRRARRILPALFVVLVTTLAFGWLILPPSNYKELARTAISTSLFVSNFDFAKLTGYFDGAADLKPLLHMWSLAVEEQYYIIFPPFLYIAWRYLGRRNACAILWLLAIVALGASEIGRHFFRHAAYYLLPFRAVELLIGALFSICGLPALQNARMRHATSLLGLGMMLAAIAFFSPTTPFPGLAALLPCIGAGLFIYAGVSDQTIGGRLLSFKSIIYVGAISYSFYLWHWPILAFLRNLTVAELPIAWAISAVSASLVLASLSYHFIEQPFQSPWGRNLPYLKLAVVETGVVVLMSAAVYLSNGLPRRFSPAAQQMFAASQDYNHRRDSCHNGGSPVGIIYSKSCVFGAVSARPDLAVWGDSHGSELVAYLGERASRRGRSVRELTSSACPPALHINVPDRPYCSKTNQGTLEALIHDPAIRTVVLTANGIRYDDKIGLETGMRASVEALMLAGKRVVLIKQIPLMPYDISERAGLFTQRGLSLDGLGLPRSTALAQVKSYDAFIDALGREDNVDIYDPKSALCASNFCHAVIGGADILYFNSEHLSIVGVSFAFKSLADILYQS
ncbi:acyltransferase family protein [Novosphingobium sediminicola]|uniref:Peptidoglycan/LPS O-acetylase OafA/YrhL n=1 Tax=Novosphingobium sediminicola TaxID=563162 RepID=A0A7W6CHE5_9SPHN|nr:acyltransferase family protein [Novosphingobium sediminicola]MBB3955530.1 peptidoglycan/LPS O-acetylase OafA/YrhL [Novosphingobium sediminicola]